MSKKSLMKGLIGKVTENKDNIKLSDKDVIQISTKKDKVNEQTLKKDTNSIQEIKQEAVITSDKEIIDYTELERRLSEILAAKSSNVSEYISNNNELFQFFCSLIETVIPIYEKSKLNPIINAFEAAAKVISVSVIAPTAPWITLTLTSSVESFSKDCLIASTEP